MQVHIQNDGPVTLAIETPQLPPQKEVSSSLSLTVHHTACNDMNSCTESCSSHVEILFCNSWGVTVIVAR